MRGVRGRGLVPLGDGPGADGEGVALVDQVRLREADPGDRPARPAELAAAAAADLLVRRGRGRSAEPRAPRDRPAQGREAAAPPPFSQPAEGRRLTTPPGPDAAGARARDIQRPRPPL